MPRDVIRARDPRQLRQHRHLQARGTRRGGVGVLGYWGIWGIGVLGVLGVGVFGCCRGVVRVVCGVWRGAWGVGCGAWGLVFLDLGLGLVRAGGGSSMSSCHCAVRHGASQPGCQLLRRFSSGVVPHPRHALRLNTSADPTARSGPPLKTASSPLPAQAHTHKAPARNRNRNRNRTRPPSTTWVSSRKRAVKISGGYFS